MKQKITMQIKKNKNIILDVLMSLFLICIYFIYGTMEFPVANDNNFKQLYPLMFSFVFLFLFLFIYFNKIKKDFVILKKDFKANFHYILKMVLILIFIIMLGNMTRDLVFGITKRFSQELVYPNIIQYPLYVFYVLIIYTPIIEGIIFTKVFYAIFKNKYIFLLISSLTYAVLQMGFNVLNFSSIITVIPYFCFGIVLFNVYIKKQNIVLPILIWSLYNLIVFLTNTILPYI